MTPWQTGPTPAPVAPPLTWFDYVMSGGCIGFLVIGTTALGLLLGLVFVLVLKRRTAIIATSVLSAVPVTLGLLGTVYGYIITDRMVARLEAEGSTASPAELADAHHLALVTTWMGLAGSGLLLAYVLLAVVLKPKPAPE